MSPRWRGLTIGALLLSLGPERPRPNTPESTTVPAASLSVCQAILMNNRNSSGEKNNIAAKVDALRRSLSCHRHSAKPNIDREAGLNFPVLEDSLDALYFIAGRLAPRGSCKCSKR
jgi:hypothetical protein